MILQIVCCMKTMYFKAAAIWKLLNSIGNQFNNNVKMPLNVSENNVTFVLALAVTKLTI